MASDPPRNVCAHAEDALRITHAALHDLASTALTGAYPSIRYSIDWLRGEFEATPRQLAALMFSCLPDALRKAYESGSSHR